jgi:Rrf2 family protein
VILQGERIHGDDSREALNLKRGGSGRGSGTTNLIVAFLTCFFYGNNMSATNTQFSIAIHIMAVLGYGANVDFTSSDLAVGSINACPSFVRRILSKLSKAGLVRTSRGKSGTCLLARPARDISLLDIYKAVDAPKVFEVHTYPTQELCPVSCGFKHMMGQVLDKSQLSFESTLAKTSLTDIIEDLKILKN